MNRSSPINPTARVYPRDYIQTGISAVDGMNSLLRGQKLPIFSGAGMPHDQLAAQIVRQATLGAPAGAPASQSEQFAIVFAAMGVKHDVADFFRKSFMESGALTRVAMFLNLADDPPVERLVTPRAALTSWAMKPISTPDPSLATSSRISSEFGLDTI